MQEVGFYRCPMNIAPHSRNIWSNSVFAITIWIYRRFESNLVIICRTSFWSDVRFCGIHWCWEVGSVIFKLPSLSQVRFLYLELQRYILCFNHVFAKVKKIAGLHRECKDLFVPVFIKVRNWIELKYVSNWCLMKVSANKNNWIVLHD